MLYFRILLGLLETPEIRLRFLPLQFRGFYGEFSHRFLVLDQSLGVFQTQLPMVKTI